MSGVEVLGALASAFTVFELCTKLGVLISEWRDCPEYIRSLEKSVQDWKSVLELATTEIHKNETGNPYGRHARVITNITKDCSKLVEDIGEQIPKDNSAVSHRDKLRQALGRSKSKQLIQEKEKKIQECTSRLQLCLTALTSEKTTNIITGIDELHGKFDKALPAASKSVDDIDQIEKAWDESRPGYQDSVDESLVTYDQHSQTSLFLQKLESRIREDMKNRANLSEERNMFLKAAQIIQEMIQDLRAKIQLDLDDEISALQQRRADLLLKCFTCRHHKEALIVFLDLLRQENGRSDSVATLERRGNLQFKLALLYRDEDGLGEKSNPDRARELLIQSMKNLSSASSIPKDNFLRASVMLLDTLRARQEEALAAELDSIIRETARTVWKDGDAEINWDHHRETAEFDAIQPRQAHYQQPDQPITSPLHMAIQLRETSIVRRMLVEVEDMELKDPNGMTPLMLAARTRRSDIAKLLLQYEASIQARDTSDRTVLHLCQEGDHKNGTAIATLLLDKDPALVDQQDRHELTALHLACRNGHEKMTQLLLERNASPNLQEENGKTALLMAVESDKSVIWHQINSARGTSIPSVNARMEPIIPISSQVDRRAHYPPTGGQFDDKQRSQSMSSELDDKQRSPSMSSGVTSSSSRPRRPSVIESLLSHNADPTIPDHTDHLPLHTACRRGHTLAVKLLLEYWALRREGFVNQCGPRGETPLIAAIKNGHSTIARQLVHWGANPNHTDDSGRSAIYHADIGGIKSVLHGRNPPG